MLNRCRFLIHIYNCLIKIHILAHFRIKYEHKVIGDRVIAPIKPYFRPGNAGSKNNNKRGPYAGRNGNHGDKDGLRINEEITAKEVRLVGDNIDSSNVVSIFQARKIAEEKELDLVEISPKAEPPVCRIVDYQKFLYQQKKKAKEIKAKTVKVVIKEIDLALTQMNTTTTLS